MCVIVGVFCRIGVLLPAVHAYLYWTFSIVPWGCVPSSWLFTTMCSPHSIAVKLCAVSVKRFLIQSRFVFYAGQYVVQLLSFFNEAQNWGGLVERPYDREHVQAIWVCFGREHLTLFFA